ncbi:hypothetical protein [Nonomuraea sp. NPDC050691]|uniref:PP2C family protein-serine/threonine phosphatase n=1 Tax=Nonomuraea sp. NPDC050691 TaxID=3155661 RepID=UPI0033F68267
MGEALAAGDLLNMLEDAVEQANRAVHDAAGSETSGTTLTAMLWTGSQLALVHIGDSRAYLLRGAEFFQITTDHTIVQSMVDQGRLTAEEATTHPQRSLLLRALSGAGQVAPDIRLHDCSWSVSDGVSASVAGRDDHPAVVLAHVVAGLDEDRP